MKNDKITFYVIKLFLLLIVAACSALFAFLATSIIQPFENELIYNCVITGFPMLFFFIFTFSIESKIKVPDGDVLTPRYFATFTLRETSVYALFLLPLTILFLAKPDFLGSGFLYRAYAPHTLLLYLTESALLNFIALLIVYAAVAFAAHKLRCNKKERADVTGIIK